MNPVDEINRPTTRLSADLDHLLRHASRSHGMSIGQIEAELRGRGFDILIILMSIPFVVPMLPGLSTPFGLAIAVMGIRLASLKRPWLPKFVLARRIEDKHLKRILSIMRSFAQKMERLVKPRMLFVLQWPLMPSLIGVGIASGGLILALPLPIPFSNTLPALSVLLLAAGMMERDGLLILSGHVTGVLAWGYLIGWLAAGKVGYDSIEHWFPWA
jgi:hypothetical protein